MFDRLLLAAAAFVALLFTARGRARRNATRRRMRSRRNG